MVSVCVMSTNICEMTNNCVFLPPGLLLSLKGIWTWVSIQNVHHLPWMPCDLARTTTQRNHGHDSALRITADRTSEMESEHSSYCFDADFYRQDSCKWTRQLFNFFSPSVFHYSVWLLTLSLTFKTFHLRGRI